MNKLTDRQRQAIATKLRITKIASELFKSNGFDSVKIQDICEAGRYFSWCFLSSFQIKNGNN